MGTIDTIAQPPAETVATPRRRPTRQVNLEIPLDLKQRLDAVSFETGVSVRILGRYAITLLVRDAEANMKKFAGKVARVRMEFKHEHREGLRP